MQVQQQLAPVLRFETRPKQDNTKSLEAGRPVFVDVDYLTITSPGTRDTFEAEAAQWLSQKRREAALGNYNLEWIDKFEEATSVGKTGRKCQKKGGRCACARRSRRLKFPHALLSM